LELEQLKIDRDSAGSRRRKRRVSGWVTPLVIVAILGFVGFLFRAKIGDVVDNLTLPKVKVERVVERNAASVAAATGTSANGYIVARTRAALSADTPGRVVAMNVEEGSTVKKGDVVARLYSDEYAANLARAVADVTVAEAGKTRAEANVVTAEKSLASLHTNVIAAQADVEQNDAALKLAQISLERSKSLLASKVDTVDRVDRAQNDLDEAIARLSGAKARLEAARQAVVQGEAELAAARTAVAEENARIVSAKAARDLAQATLDKTEVRAPFDGIVVLKDAEVGEVVSPNSQGGSNARGSLVTMVDFATLEVQVDLQETSLAAVKEGAPVSIYVDAWPDQRYSGRVRRIWPTANRQKATVEVRVTIDAPDSKLRPEMGARVVFATPSTSEQEKAVAQEPALLVQKSAIVKVDGKSGVFVLERDVARFRPVVLGPERSGRVVVQSGIHDGDQVVDEPPTSLFDGDRVRIQE
jgi:RND family efflux transporter MFP subunit